MSTTSTESSRPQQGRVLNIVLWILQALLALAFLGAGFTKLFGIPAMVELFADVGIGQWFRYVTGLLEVAGAVGLLIPRLCGLAALGLICVMVGAITSHIFILGTNFVLPLVYLVLLVVVAWGRWDRVRSLIGVR